MEQYKFNQLITKFEFVVGIMKLLENKTIEAFMTALHDYQKLKNTVVWKSSIRLRLNDVEYYHVANNVVTNFNPDESDEKLEIDGKEIDETQYNHLTDSIVKRLIINHYLANK